MIRTLHLSQDTDDVIVSSHPDSDPDTPIAVRLQERGYDDFRKAWLTVDEAKELIVALALAIASTES